MQYLLLFATAEDGDPYVAEEDDIVDWVVHARSIGADLGGERLRPPEDATTVTRREGRTIVTDGPFTESKEWIAGYGILEAADLDAAIELASRHPMARYGQVEIRPVWSLNLDLGHAS